MTDNIIIIGSSTGGPKLLSRLFAELPVINASLIIVQHVPPILDASITRRLNSLSPMDVTLAENGEALQSPRVYIAPANRHLLLHGNREIELKEFEKVNGCCPAIDVTMRSIVNTGKHSITGVILSGFGIDGVVGLSHIKKIGGTTIALDEESCCISGMPGEAIKTGNVDHVLRAEMIGAKLVDLVGGGHGPLL